MSLSFRPPVQSFPQALLSHCLFAGLVFLASTPALAYFILAAPAAATPLAAAYKWSVLGYYGGLVGIAALFALPLAAFAWTRWLVGLAAWLWLIYLAIDLATFKLYQFHVNWVLIEMFLMDFRGLGIPWPILALFGGVGLGLAGLVLLLGRLARHLARRAGLLALAVLATVGAGTLAAHSVTSIWAIHYAREEITQHNPFFPVFWAIQSHKHGPQIAAAWPRLFPAQAGKATEAAGPRRGIVSYPLKAPECGPGEKQSILLIAVESWQASSLTPEVMPNLWKFSTRSARFEQHVSSGSSTVPGLFGLLFGLHATYYDLLKTSPNSHPSVFTETLARQGYRSRVFTSGNLDRFALRTLFFSKVPAADYLELYDDTALVERYLASLGADQQKDKAPRFDFIFLTASHSPYAYPPEFARFKPLPKMAAGYAIDNMTDAAPYKNQYHNSLAYIDSLLGKLFAHPEWQRRLANTWVVITGDHAEEFNENGLGYWGHGSNYTRWQTQTPLVVHAPKRAPHVESRLSLHQDVVPTLMRDALGCAGPSDDYASGRHLFELPDTRGTVISSYFSTAYLVGGTIIDRTTGKKYAWNDMKEARSLDDPQALRQLIDEERRFLAARP